MFFTRVFLLSSVWMLSSGFFSCREEPASARPRSPLSSNSWIQKVDPFIGTGGILWASGHTTPAASAPFGLMKLGPDTSLLGKSFSHSGYASSEPEVRGFSHTRYSGTGVGDGGLLRVAPFGKSVSFADFSKARMFHTQSSEVAWPGYYATYLTSSECLAEMTVRENAGIHRYTFTKTKDPMIYIDLSSVIRGQVSELNVTVDIGTQSISGSGRLAGGFSARYGGLPFYFQMTFNQPLKSAQLVTSTQSGLNSYVQTGSENVLAEIQVQAEAGTAIELRVGLSYISASGASTHFSSVSGTFESVLTQTEGDWETLLGRVKATGGTDDFTRQFYSALYRSFLMPMRFGDSPSGNSMSYLGFDKTVHNTTDHLYYSDMSLWDTFRTVHPLYNLIARTEQKDIIKSLILMAEQGGRLPRWPSGAGYTGSMLGHPASILISESFQKGITDFDSDKALDQMVALGTPGQVNGGQECLEAYVSLGYCPMEAREGSVSQTLEYAWADAAIARMAKLKDQTARYEQFSARSGSFENHFDNRFGYFMPRHQDGRFLQEDHPAFQDNSYIKATDIGKGYVEGGPRHWRFYPIFAFDRLQALMGDRMIAGLDEMFENAKPSLGNAFPPYFYWQGNEPDFLNVVAYSLAGRWDLAQKWTQWVLDKKYRRAPAGLDGDDDAGTLSAWLVLAGIGIFPIAGTDQYVLLKPQFDKVELDMGSNKILVVQRASAKETYSSATLNGTALPNPTFLHSQIIDGATVEFQ